MVVRSLLTMLGFDVKERQVNKYNKALKKVVTTTKVLAVGTAALGAAVLKGAGDIEQVTIAFETMLGSASEADKLLKDITDFAAKTPFELTGLIQSSKQLLAFGLEAEKIIPTMTNLGNIAAGVGRDKLPSIILAFGKIRTKGKATMEELNILLEAGVPVLDALAKNMGVTTKELTKMVSKGVVGFDDVDAALRGLATGNGKFANLMEKQSKSFLGIVSNILDFLVNLRNEIGGRLLGAAKSIARGFLEFLQANREVIASGAVKFFRAVAFAVAFVFIVITRLIRKVGGLSNLFNTLISILKTVFSVLQFIFDIFVAFHPLILGVVAAFLAYNAVLKALAIKSILLAAKTAIMTAAQWALNAAMLANPIGLVIAAIAGLVVAGILLVKNWDKVKKAMIKLWMVIKKFVLRIWNVFSRLLDNPFFSIIAVILSPWITIPALIIKHWERVRSFFINLWGGLVRVFKTSVEFISGTAQRLWASFMELLDSPFLAALGILLAPFFTIPALIIKHWDRLKKGFMDLWDNIKIIFNNAKEFIKNFVDTTVALANTIKDTFLSVFQGIKDVFGKITDFGSKITDTLKGFKSFLGIGGDEITAEGTLGAATQGAINNKSNTFNIRSNVSVGVPSGTPEEQQRQIELASKSAVREEWDNILRNTMSDVPSVDFVGS